MSPSMDVIAHLQAVTGLDDKTLAGHINRRAGRPGQADDQWWYDAPRPQWAQRTAARWLLELWQQERNACDSRQLLDVDRKYSKILKVYTVAEIIQLMDRNGEEA